MAVQNRAATTIKLQSLAPKNHFNLPKIEDNTRKRYIPEKLLLPK
jgi:hypothetical protein